jgi:hypothetical protein
VKKMLEMSPKKEEKENALLLTINYSSETARWELLRVDFIN